MDPLIIYLQEGNLPEDRQEAKKVRRKSPRYYVSEEGKLYKRSYLGPYLLCVHSLRNCTKGYVEVTWEEGLWHIGLLPRGTGGRACRSKPKNFLKSVTNAKDLFLTSISLEEFLI